MTLSAVNVLILRNHPVENLCDMCTDIALSIAGAASFPNRGVHLAFPPMLIGGRPIGILPLRPALAGSSSLASYLSASFKSRIFVNGSALSASHLTSLARSSINSSMQGHLNHRASNPSLLSE